MSSESEAEEDGFFGVTQDDYDDEFDPNKHHRRGRSKEDAIYGVFQEDVQAGRPPPRRQKRAAGSKLSFVAGGAQVSQDQEEGSEASDSEVVRRLGLGEEEGSDMETEPNVAVAPPPSMPPPKRTADPFQKKDPAAAPAAAGQPPSMAGQKPAYSSFTAESAAAAKPDKEFAKWDTMGKMARMMAKMGYKKGQGLGKFNQGVAGHIEVKVRKNKLGLQEEGEMTKQAKRDFGVEKKDKDEEFREQIAQWKAPVGSERSRRVKYKFKTAEAFIPKDKAQAESSMSQVKVVDMSGPTPRVVHGYDHIKQQDHLPVLSGQDGTVPMPELQHNVNMILEDCATEVHDLNMKIRRETESDSSLKAERKSMSERVGQEGYHINRLEKLLAMIAEVKAQTARGMTLETAEQLFASLHHQFTKEYKVYQLSALVPAVAFPLIKRELQGWDPLSNPKQPINLMRGWRRILENEEVVKYAGNAMSNDSMGDYERLCWSVVVPFFRAAFSGTWEPKRQTEEGVQLLEMWADVFPQWILKNILEQLVAPKIVAAVEAWNPRTDPIMVHVWIHPWLPLLRKRLKPVYPIVRQKLASCLKIWEASDPSALKMIEPWKDVFSSKDMAVFLVCNVSPRLEKALQDLRVDPRNPVITPIEYLLQWRHMMPISETVSLFEKHVWPKFIEKLCEWLNRETANYEDIADWYLEWKRNVFYDRDLRATSTFQNQFRMALEFMEQAVSNVNTSADYRKHRKRARVDKSATVPKAAPSEIRSGPAGTIDLVRKVAEECGVVFDAKYPRAEVKGHKVWAFGSKLQMYFDHGIPWGKAKGQDDYRPMSVQELRERRFHD